MKPPIATLIFSICLAFSLLSAVNNPKNFFEGLAQSTLWPSAIYMRDKSTQQKNEQGLQDVDEQS